MTEEAPAGARRKGSQLVDLKSSVLRLLAAGLSPEAAADRLAQRFKTGLTAEDVRATLRDAAELLTQDAPLLPPAEAAFTEQYWGVVGFAAVSRNQPWPPVVDPSPRVDCEGSSRPDLALLRTRSRHLVRELMQPGERPSTSDALPPQEQSIALQYGEAVLRQAEILKHLEHLGSDAPLHAALPDPDRQRVAEFVLYRSLRGSFQTLDSLLESWQRLMQTLADRQESLLFEEYCDWLIQRDSLEDMLTLLSPPARKEIEPRVSELDDVFMQASVDSGVTLGPGTPWTFHRWWWYRRPERVNRDFRRRLDALARDVRQTESGRSAHGHADE